MMQIIPSVLVDSEKKFISQLNAVQDILPMIQLDIADGVFVPNTTWAEPSVVERECEIDVELHLMVRDPLHELERWSATEVIQRVLIHFESVTDFRETLRRASEYGWQVGAVLNPDTDWRLVEPYLAELSAVMFMGVHPGFQGQKLIPDVLSAMAEFKSLNPTTFMSIDGGVNEETLADIAATDADSVCPGSVIFGNERSPADNIARMQKIINSLTEQKT